MFKLLKERLKKAVSVFSRKVKSEVEDSEREEGLEKEAKKQEKALKKGAKKEEKSGKKLKKSEEPPEKESKKEEPDKKARKKKEKKPKKKEGQKKTPKPKEEIIEELKEEPEEEETKKEEEPEKKEKKGFFSKIFGKKEKEEVADEEAEEERPEEETIEGKEKIPEEKEEEPEEEQAKKGIFQKAVDVFTKKTISESKFEELFYELEITLLENNVAVEVIDKIKDDLKAKIAGIPLPRGKITDIIIETLRESVSGLFDVPQIKLIQEIQKKKEKPYIISFIGVNGSGKTTTLAKIANLCLKNKMEPVMVASDTFRAAAIQQLEEHAKNLKVKIIKHDYGSDAAAVAYDGIEHAKAKGKDVVLIDTAGRLHSNINLMDELKKVHRVAKPDLTIFVGEAITGNDCIEQAIKFNEAVEFNAIVLTKADVDEKGGASISVSYVTGKPILFIGTGQEYDDIEKFSAEKVIESLGL